jgi:aspartate aminotransferase
LNTINGFTCGMPEGAFYAFVDVREMLGGKFKTSADVANEMLSKAHVVVTDGAAFGADGFLRFSYATSMDNLRGAVERIGNLVNAAAVQPV